VFGENRLIPQHLVPRVPVPPPVVETRHVPADSRPVHAERLGEAITSPPFMQQNAIRQLPRVTSARARKLPTLCRQIDTTIGGAVRVAAKSD